MAKQESIYIPWVHIWDSYNGRPHRDYDIGFFGDLPIYSFESANKELSSLGLLRENGYRLRFKDIHFGPYIDFNSLKGKELLPLDDFLVVCDSNNTITIYDKNKIDDIPGKIDWSDIEKNDKVIVFKPRLTLCATHKHVYDPRKKYVTEDDTKRQSYVETEVCKILEDMDLGGEGRFFKPLLKINGKPVKDFRAPDSAFLLKCSQDFYVLYEIYSAKFAFKVSYFWYEELHGQKTLPNTMELIKDLRKVKYVRNKYFQEQYGR